MKKIIFATNNKNKAEEIRLILGEQFEIITLKEAGILIEIPEPYHTLKENAIEKAKVIHNMTHENCFSEDTGLEVEALDGKPGVYSARYAGEHGNAEKNMEKLLVELQNKLSRKAKFRTIIALNITNKQYLFEGICDGEILNEKTGVKGFGYDPIFKPSNASCSFAEMNSEEKNIISHRSIAIQKLVQFLNSL